MVHFRSIFGGQKIFPKNLAVMHNYKVYTKLIIQFQENAQADRQMKEHPVGKTETPYFIRSFSLPPRVQKAQLLLEFFGVTLTS